MEIDEIMRKENWRYDETAQFLNVSESTVKRLAESGCFIVFKVGSSRRIKKKSVFDYLNRRAEEFAYENGFILSDKIK